MCRGSFFLLISFCGLAGELSPRPHHTDCHATAACETHLAPSGHKFLLQTSLCYILPLRLNPRGSPFEQH